MSNNRRKQGENKDEAVDAEEIDLEIADNAEPSSTIAKPPVEKSEDYEEGESEEGEYDDEDQYSDPQNESNK